MSHDSIKCVVVGDSKAGKTAILTSYAENTFNSEHQSTIFENYDATIYFKNKLVSLSLYDTPSEDVEYNESQFRPLCYPETNIFLIVFSLIDQKTLDNVSLKWYPEIRKFSDDAPIFLVGAKLDLREDCEIMKELKDRGENVITYDEGKKVADELEMIYFECSAKRKANIEDIFLKCVELVIDCEDLNHSSKKILKCSDYCLLVLMVLFLLVILGMIFMIVVFSERLSE